MWACTVVRVLCSCCLVSWCHPFTNRKGLVQCRYSSCSFPRNLGEHKYADIAATAWLWYAICKWLLFYTLVLTIASVAMIMGRCRAINGGTVLIAHAQTLDHTHFRHLSMANNHTKAEYDGTSIMKESLYQLILFVLVHNNLNKR